jgi:hypothetical protein
MRLYQFLIFYQRRVEMWSGQFGVGHIKGFW